MPILEPGRDGGASDGERVTEMEREWPDGEEPRQCGAAAPRRERSAVSKGAGGVTPKKNPEASAGFGNMAVIGDLDKPDWGD